MPNKPPPASTTLVEPGLYRHFKGGLYFVVSSSGRDADTGEEMVEYLDAATGARWFRRWSDWNNPAVVNGQPVARFVQMSCKTPAQIRTFMGDQLPPTLRGK